MLFKKREDDKKLDERIGPLLGRALGTLPTEEKCPALEDIAALVENKLTGRHRERVLSHLAACDRCREVYTMSCELAKEDAPARIPDYSWQMMRLVPVALAACLILIVISWPLLTNRQSGSTGIQKVIAPYTGKPAEISRPAEVAAPAPDIAIVPSKEPVTRKKTGSRMPNTVPATPAETSTGRATPSETTAPGKDLAPTLTQTPGNEYAAGLKTQGNMEPRRAMAKSGVARGEAAPSSKMSVASGEAPQSLAKAVPKNAEEGGATEMLAPPAGARRRAVAPLADSAPAEETLSARPLLEGSGKGPANYKRITITEGLKQRLRESAGTISDSAEIEKLVKELKLDAREFPLKGIKKVVVVWSKSDSASKPGVVAQDTPLTPANAEISLDKGVMTVFIRD